MLLTNTGKKLCRLALLTLNTAE